MYIDNISLRKSISTWLLFMFWIISIMIVVGGLTRLTDSGLSITQWQLFSGFLPPLNNADWNNYFDLYKQIPEFTEQNYLMTINEFKVIFWWEWAHRFLGRLIGIAFLLESYGIVLNPGFLFRFTAVVCITTGTMLLLWLGEKITEHGIGNGISLIIMVGILAAFPNVIVSEIAYFQQGVRGILSEKFMFLSGFTNLV